MKYCTNCGTQLSDDAKFCSVCGTKQEVKKDGPKEEFFTASETAGEVVLSSWSNPKPKAESTATGTQYQQQPQQNYPQVAAPQKKNGGFFRWIVIILLILMILYFLASILEG